MRCLWIMFVTAVCFLAPSTLIHFQTKTELFCSRYGYRPHYNAENDHRKRSNSKTLSRVEWFENDAFWKRCFLVWTEKTMLSENGDVIKRDTTGRQTTRPWVSKMVDRRFHVASISRQFRRLIYWNAFTSSSFEHAHWGYNSVFKTILRCSMDGRKRCENDKCGRKSFWKRSKTAPFSFENGSLWTGPLFLVKRFSSFGRCCLLCGSNNIFKCHECVCSKARVRIPLSGKHCSLQLFVKHVVEHVGVRKEAQKRGLGSKINLKLCRLEKGQDGNKAYAISIQAQWDEEKSMFSNRGMVLQGSLYLSYNNYRYCMILHQCHAAYIMSFIPR